MCELKLRNDSLMKENVTKDREIRQLNKDAQQYEQTIMNLRKEISMMNCHTPDVSKRDAEVMAGMCWTGTECGDWEPVKDFSEMLRVETQQFQDRIQKMESNLKASSESVRALRKVNVSLTEEMHAMRRVCAALVEESRAATVRAQFKDDIIREMRRQLKQAKAKHKPVIYCHGATSTPDVSKKVNAGTSPNVSIIERSPSPPILVSDVSIEDPQDEIKCSFHLTPSDPSTSNSGQRPSDNCSGRRFPRICLGSAKKSPSPSTSKACPGLNISNACSGSHSPKTCQSPRTSKICLSSRSPSTRPGSQAKPCSAIRSPKKSPNTRPLRICPSPETPVTSLRSRSQRTCPSPETSVISVRQLSAEPCSSKTPIISLGPKTPIISPGPITSVVSLEPPVPQSSSGVISSRPCLCRAMKDSPRSRNAQIQIPVRKDKCQECFEELFFNSKAKKSDECISEAPCGEDDCKQAVKKTLPCNVDCAAAMPAASAAAVAAASDAAAPAASDAAAPAASDAAAPAASDAATPAASDAAAPAASDAAVATASDAATPAASDTAVAAACDAATPAVCDAATPAVCDAATPAVCDAATPAVCDAATPAVCDAAIAAPWALKKEFVNRSCSAIYKDSGGACSLVDSVTGSCDANARAAYYHNKLRSTLQILQNKEETIRVQAESLSVAEGRISTLTERATELRRELERKSKELQALRKTLECCRVEKVDAAIEAESEMENQTDIVNTLQNNLSVIEDLYRECFYETAKQEGLIDMLRKSYLDVRLMDKQKADQIGRMQTVINTQKWSLDRCQDIALEVDNLKMEISNFLSSSNTSTNYDSGMWERSEESFASVPGVQEELQDVMEQLLRLREILTLGCTCGLEEENMRLKRENEALEKKIAEMCCRKCELEQSLVIKDSQAKQNKEEIKSREEQLATMRREIIKLREEVKEKTTAGEQLSQQLGQSQVLLHDKSEELSQIKQQCDSQRETINQLRQEFKKADNMCKENCKIRSEVVFLSDQVAQWRSQLLESEGHARKLETKLRQMQACYREKESSVVELQSQLEQAHARGAELCRDARRALCAVRQWAKRMRDRHREHENIIKQKKSCIASLQRRLEEHNSTTTVCTSTSDADPPCSKCSTVSRPPSCCSKLEATRSQSFDTCASEVANCSSAPTPPKRLFRKKPICGEKRAEAPWMCEASVQQPTRQDASVDPRMPFCTCLATTSRSVSPPADELFSRVEQLSKAFADGYRRWTKADPR